MGGGSTKHRTPKVGPAQGSKIFVITCNIAQDPNLERHVVSVSLQQLVYKLLKGSKNMRIPISNQEVINLFVELGKKHKRILSVLQFGTENGPGSGSIHVVLVVDDISHATDIVKVIVTSFEPMMLHHITTSEPHKLRICAFLETKGT
jgi:hypothetical protein